MTMARPQRRRRRRRHRSSGAEGTWTLVKRDLGNLAAADLGEITRAVKGRLKGIQYRPDLVDGIAASGLSLHT